MNFLVTGGGSGLGESLVRRLAAEATNKVYFTYFNSEQNASQLCTELKNVEAIKCDYSHYESVSQVGEAIPGMDIDVLVNNALPGMRVEHFHKTDIRGVEKSFTANIVPVLLITQEAIKFFRKKKFGRIITILSSYVVNSPPIGLSDYVAGKAYLLSMSKSWAAENQKFNITANTISPSMMLTRLVDNIDERQIEEVENSSPGKTLLTTNEVAEAVSYFAKGSGHINGINFVINAAANVI